MNNKYIPAVALAILLVLVLIFIYYRKSEKMINEMDYRLISRGLNAPNTSGYYPVVTFLSAVEHSKIEDYIPNT